MAIVFSILALLSTLLTLTLISLSTVIISSRRSRRKAAGFFHPFTNDGGGGERVLWCAVRAVQEERPDLEVAILTGDDASPESLSARALNRFGVSLLRPPQVVRLSKRKWIEEKTYPHFTMIGQSLGSVYLAWEALTKFTPQFYFDTSGYAFTYPLARMFGSKVICYTHYPTISLDMLSRVRQRNPMYNNDAVIARSFLMLHGEPILIEEGIDDDEYMHKGDVRVWTVELPSTNLIGSCFKFKTCIWLSRCKVLYYTFFSWLYGLVGSSAHVVMVNSSWTRSHIEKLWKIPERTRRVYPPCDTSALQALPLERPTEVPIIISVAQFRPEKAHTLQLEAFSLAIQRLDPGLPKPKLQFVGSCRNKEDQERLEKLREKSIALCLEEDVEFHKDVMYRDLIQLLGGAVAGLHSMIDEHFGISVVEYMAAGAIPIAHASAGPKMDIVLNEDGCQTGFLACDKEEYADAILKVLRMPKSERLLIAASARKRAQRFSEQKFCDDFKAAIHHIISRTKAPG